MYFCNDTQNNDVYTCTFHRLGWWLFFFSTAGMYSYKCQNQFVKKIYIKINLWRSIYFFKRLFYFEGHLQREEETWCERGSSSHPQDNCPYGHKGRGWAEPKPGDGNFIQIIYMDVLLLNTLSGSWIGIGTAGTCTGTQMRCQCHRQRLNLLCHSTGPKTLFFKSKIFMVRFCFYY